MRHPSSMHWHLWEAIRMEVDDMYSKGLVGEELMDKARFISHHTPELGIFSTKLRMMACEVEEALKPIEDAWQNTIEQLESV